MVATELQVNQAYVPFMDTTKRYAILYGGAGSGKSVAAADKVLLRVVSEPNHRIWVLRRYASTLQLSVFNLLVERAESLGIRERFVITRRPMMFKDIYNGNEIIFTGLDDAEKLKSLQRPTSIWVEEATEIEYPREFTQLDLRLRGQMPNYKQIILTFNPVDESHWIKGMFFDKQAQDVFIKRTTYKDNAFIDNDYRQVLNKRVRADENMYRIYVLGEWGKLNTGAEFYKHFKYNLHTGSFKHLYNTHEPLHLCFDFNSIPYNTCTVWTLTDGGKTFTCIDELCLTPPNNSTLDVCDELKLRYREHGGGCFVYGDASGYQRDTRTSAGYDDFGIIQKSLTSWMPQMRVPAANPPVHMRGVFINEILRAQFEGLKIQIDQHCLNLLADMNNVDQNSDGGKVKKKVRNSANGQSYEPYGHTSDSMDYGVCEVWRSQFLKFQGYETGTFNYQAGKDIINRKHRF